MTETQHPFPAPPFDYEPAWRAAVARANALQDALRQAAMDLRTVGDDYPGSSCQAWCHERAALCDAALPQDTASPPPAPRRTEADPSKCPHDVSCARCGTRWTR
jgi:hypothetical protein